MRTEASTIRSAMAFDRSTATRLASAHGHPPHDSPTTDGWQLARGAYASLAANVRGDPVVPCPYLRRASIHLTMRSLLPTFTLVISPLEAHVQLAEEAR